MSPHPESLIPRTAGILAVVLTLLAPVADGQTPKSMPKDEQPEPATAERKKPRRGISVSRTKGGYIDSAFVGSQVRLRYDSAFDGNRADRAEFFYGKCFCYFDPDAANGPGPAEDLDFQELELGLEYGFNERYSVFVEVPFRDVDVRVPANLVAPLGLAGPELAFSGLGDIRVGFKYAVIASPERYLTLQLRAYLPSGDPEDGLGTDHFSLEPALLFHRELSDRWTFESELRLWIPTSGSSDPTGTRANDFAGEVLRYGVGVSYDPRPGGGFRLVPVAEVVGWSVLGGFATNPQGQPEDSNGDTIANLKLGLRFENGGRGSWYLGYGFALTDDVWYDDIVRFEYRLALGGRNGGHGRR